MATMRIPDHPRYSTNFRGEAKGTDVGPCVVCGKPVKAPGKLFVHVIDGGGSVCTPDEDDAHWGRNDDLGIQPIGSDCARRHPEMKPYIRR